MIREPFVAGAFYPESCVGVKKYLNIFNGDRNREKFQNVRAIVVPHAGIKYSGYTANKVYRGLKGSKYRRAIVIGPSHYVQFSGVSISKFDKFYTPCGYIDIDKDYIAELENKFSFIFEPEIHKEHSTEVQAPFISEYLPESEIIELVYGQNSEDELQEIISYLLNDSDNLVVISTDLSHFYNEDEARQLDKHCLDSFANLDPELLSLGCEACGRYGLKALIKVARERGMRSSILDYRTSGDSSKDYSRVVGYMSGVLRGDEVLERVDPHSSCQCHTHNH